MKQALLFAGACTLTTPNRGLVRRTDASDYAIGVVLEQVLDDWMHPPIAFWSQVLIEGQRRVWAPRHGSREVGRLHKPAPRHHLY